MKRNEFFKVAGGAILGGTLLNTLVAAQETPCKRCKSQYYYINEKCTLCGDCAKACPVKAIAGGNDRFHIQDSCNNCVDHKNVPQCVKVCTVNAVIKIE